MSNDSVITLVETREFIAGDDYPFKVKATRENGSAVDLTETGTTIKFVMCEYNNPSLNVLEKENDVTTEISVDSNDHSIFTVYLPSTDTSDLEGMYTYQIIVTAPNGAISRRLEGNFVIRSRIASAG